LVHGSHPQAHREKKKYLESGNWQGAWDIPEPLVNGVQETESNEVGGGMMGKGVSGAQ
jgi:hypothetical protein